ncbi:MAG: Gfo/Idh/MocA family oxidoreductase [Candidatus Latescibacteria bacterium]|nr:Gfo/Idh/MocA family oxidoreductase [Candidatus Latescibacterota bacterium]
MERNPQEIDLPPAPAGVSGREVRAAIYGTGSWANQTHIPNLKKLGVDVVAACDVDAAALSCTAMRFDIPAVYADGHEMVEKERFDVLFSIVPAFARTDVEIRAVERGIHLFSEKPQAIRMAVALEIDRAVRNAGVLSTVCFRERYRPLFREARRILSDKRIVHVVFRSVGGPPPRRAGKERASWWRLMDKSGGPALDWGVHAVDYTRFTTGLEIDKVQAFYYEQSDVFSDPLSSSFHFLLDNGATMTMTFVRADPSGTPQPWFTFFFEGGRLEIYSYDRIDLNGETVYRGGDLDPWFVQDRIFVEAVRSGDRGEILNDYHDGLYSLAPILAGWDSAR